MLTLWLMTTVLDSNKKKTSATAKIGIFFPLCALIENGCYVFISSGAQYSLAWAKLTHGFGFYWRNEMKKTAAYQHHAFNAINKKPREREKKITRNVFAIEPKVWRSRFDMLFLICCFLLHMFSLPHANVYHMWFFEQTEFLFFSLYFSLVTRSACFSVPNEYKSNANMLSRCGYG